MGIHSLPQWFCFLRSDHDIWPALHAHEGHGASRVTKNGLRRIDEQKSWSLLWLFSIFMSCTVGNKSISIDPLRIFIERFTKCVEGTIVGSSASQASAASQDLQMPQALLCVFEVSGANQQIDVCSMLQEIFVPVTVCEWLLMDLKLVYINLR